MNLLVRACQPMVRSEIACSGASIRVAIETAQQETFHGWAHVRVSRNQQMRAIFVNPSQYLFLVHITPTLPWLQEGVAAVPAFKQHLRKWHRMKS